MRADDELRAFLARIIGWSDTHAVELGLSSVTLAAAGCTTLVLCGQGDIVPIAWALHRRVREPGRPFIVADTRRADQPESVRSPASRGNVVLALEAARRGTCCMRLRRKPADLAEVVPLLRAADDVMLVICGGPHLASGALLIRPAPVVVPPLASRAHELDRIIVEYAGDATAELGAPHEAFTADDRAWVRDHAAGSLAEIEKATLRLVTLYTSRNLSHAAACLGMRPVSLSRWLGRREIDALAALALESFDRADWSGIDPLLVERTAYVLGMIARSAATAASKLDGLRAKVADTQPATSVDLSSDAKGSHPQLSLPYTIANCLVRHESSVISRLRRRLAEKFEQPVDYRFFSDRYLPGEDPNAALLRMFKRLQWMVSLTDEQTIDSMARRSHR